MPKSLNLDVTTYAEWVLNRMKLITLKAQPNISEAELVQVVPGYYAAMTVKESGETFSNEGKMAAIATPWESSSWAMPGKQARREICSRNRQRRSGEQGSTTFRRKSGSSGTPFGTDCTTRTARRSQGNRRQTSCRVSMRKSGGRPRKKRGLPGISPKATRRRLLSPRPPKPLGMR
ncbi:unnamed protein product, partial [Pylaiella littoralis]